MVDVLDSEGFVSDDYIRFISTVRERNKKIFEEWSANPENGKKQELAKKYGLSRERVRQIIERENGKRV